MIICCVFRNYYVTNIDKIFFISKNITKIMQNVCDYPMNMIELMPQYRVGIFF